ncbi:MAG TPA: hypothetical protein H9899_15645, partial [Candidatus Sphingomonas excrementigallinarum]|nr:hypothetical protein [Candidatus Sphingomonas excrementigallinarum]
PARFRPNHLDNSRRHDAAPVSATVPHLWLAHHLVSKVEKTGRLRLNRSSLPCLVEAVRSSFPLNARHPVGRLG